LTFQRQFHVGTGDRIQLYRVDAQSGKPVLGPDGKPLGRTFDVTGVEVSFDEVVPIAPQDSEPQMLGSQALARQFPQESMLNYDGLLVRLKPGASADAFKAGVLRIFAQHPETRGHQIADEIDHNARVQSAIRPEAIALAIFA